MKITAQKFQPGQRVKVVFPVPPSSIERCPIAEYLVRVVSALEENGVRFRQSPWHYTEEIKTNIKDRTIEVVTHLPEGMTREQVIDDVTAAANGPTLRRG